MVVLTLNCGSSSIKAEIVDTSEAEPRARVEVERLADESSPAEATFQDEGASRTLDVEGHAGALEAVLPELFDRVGGAEVVDGAAHRVVHGGDEFASPTIVDDEVVETIESLIDLAPLHNPVNLRGIRAARDILDDVPHVAVFDTAYHRTLPDRARRYAIPPEVADEHDIERFGFHGISHEYVAGRAADYLETDVRDLRLITCHLGGGCSVAAIEYGSSVETSMGTTPLEGLVMGTRSGDIDPGAILQLLRSGYSVDEVDDLLNRNSGLAGLSGVGPDLRDIKAAAADGDDQARRAIQVFSHRARKYVGAYAAVMGGVDAIVFTAGIGQNSALMRHRIGQRLDFLGARIDEEANRELELSRDEPVASFSAPNSRCVLLAARTDESRAMAEAAESLIAGEHDIEVAGAASIPVAVSARHVHLQEETVEALFGEGYELTPEKDLSQPGQFAAEEKVRVVGPDGELEDVRVLGPTRDYDQIEVSRTDEFELGIDAPVRCSGDLDQTPGVTLVGPEGRVELRRGLICAWRHIHMTPEDAERFGVEDRDRVEVAIESGSRDLVFGDVLIRLSDDSVLEMHIDTDEANAANIGRGAEGVLVESDARAQIDERRTRFD